MQKWGRIPFALALAACGGTGTTSTRREPPGPVTPAKLYTVADYAARGFTIKAVNARESLACPPDATECTCIRELECTDGTCPTLTENLATFRAAMEHITRPVYCEIAHTGQYCDLSYFRFEGDIHRYETRFFDATGQLVAQTNSTDYPEYCDGQSSMRITGVVPDCRMQPRDVEIICGEDRFKQRPIRLVNPASWLTPEAYVE